MAVLRELALYSQQRLDIPALRSLESGVCGDFDLLAGRIIAGKQPLIINGFDVSVTSSIIGNPATNLVMNVANGQLLHFNASENGSIFFVPADRTAETLTTTTNSKIVGSFSASTTNYIGIDLIKRQDITTNDSIQFINPSTDTELSKIVPMARTLDYKIYIQTTPFSATSNVAPIAKVVTDANNSVVSIEDARSLMFRLGSGSDSPNPVSTFSWASRAENPIITTTGTANPFLGGDKSIASFKDWVNASATRLWELGGGEFWYSSTADRNVRLAFGTPTSPMNDNVETDGTHVRWSGLSFIFTNSTSVTNTITDHTAYDIAISNGQVLWCDVSRSTDGAVIGTLSVSNNNALSSPTIPGSRYVIAWKENGNIYVRNKEYWVGKPQTLMSPTGAGVAFSLTNPDGTGLSAVASTNPVVPLIQMTGGAYQSVSGGLTLGGTGLATAASNTITVGGGTNDSTIHLVESTFNSQIYIRSATSLIGAPLIIQGGGNATSAGAGYSVQILGGTVTGTTTKSSILLQAGSAPNATGTGSIIIQGGQGSTDSIPDVIIQPTNSGRTGHVLEVRNSTGVTQTSFSNAGNISVNGSYNYLTAQTIRSSVSCRPFNSGLPLGAQGQAGTFTIPINLPVGSSIIMPFGTPVATLNVNCSLGGTTSANVIDCSIAFVIDSVGTPPHSQIFMNIINQSFSCNGASSADFGTFTNWAASTAYKVGEVVLNDTTPIKAYRCATAGTSAASGGPTGFNSGTGNIADNTVGWEFIGVKNTGTYTVQSGDSAYLSVFVYAPTNSEWVDSFSLSYQSSVVNFNS